MPDEKTTLQIALDTFATQSTRDLVLRTMHAVVTHCFITDMAESKGTTQKETIAAEAKVYARMLKEITANIGGGHSSVPIPKIKDVQPAQMPR